jgi:hypothetical protein
MGTELEDALRTAMRSHTADLLPAPTLVEDTLRGGARRRLRTRLAIAGAPVLVVAAVLGGVTVLPVIGGGGSDAAKATLSAFDEELLARRTQGDLAGDRSYLQAATAAWRRNYRTSRNADRGIFEHLIGEPKVLWAGRTTVGPAAVVGQAADLRNHEDIQLDHEGPALLYGFVGPDGHGGATVVADAYPVPGAPTEEAALIGAGRTVLLVLYRGRPVDVSVGRVYHPDGRVDRGWQPVRFPASGVAVLDLPAGTPPGTVALRPRGPGYVGVGNVAAATDPIVVGSATRLRWSDPDGLRPVWLVGPDPASGWGGQPPDAGVAEDALTKDLGNRVSQLYPDVSSSMGSSWYAAGRTADGSRLVAGEIVLDTDPSHVYATLRAPGGTVTAASVVVHKDAATPVLLQLPRGQGWLVAQRGAQLRYRTAAGGAWVDAGHNAALLPATAVAVQVTRDGAATEQALPR